MRVLIIDNDPRSLRIIQRHLKDDYIVDVAETAEKGERLTYNNHYDILLLELMLPDMDGEDLCGIIKSRVKNLPIIAITEKASVEDKDYAFRSGVDDYLTKPVSGKELKARMNALLRRYQNDKSYLEIRVLKLRNLMMDRTKRLATYKGERLNLRRKEFQLLEFLMLNQGKVLTRGEILENVWDAHVSLFTNTVDVHVKRLRDKIEAPFGESYFETVHGVGYLFG